MPNMPNISMPTMPNMPNISMPNMPNISMPNMPHLFSKNKEEASDQEQQAKIEAAIASAGAEEEPTVDAAQLAASSANGQANVDAIQVEPQAGAVGAANGAAEGGESRKFNPLDLDASKALGTAKDLGSNFGSEHHQHWPWPPSLGCLLD